MVKGWTGFIIGIVVVLVLFGAFVYFTGSSKTVAYLNINEGTVQFNTGSGWQDATDQMKLKEDWSVKTAPDGKASIIFYESDILEMEPNTEIELARLVEENLQINQKSGSTWNRVNKLAGTETYNVETPNTVATVRGTGFGININNDNEEIVVDDGFVECKLKDGSDSENILEYQRCLIENGKINRNNVSREQLMMMRDHLQNAVIILETIQLREIHKKKFVLDMIKKRYNYTDEDIIQYIKDVNTGKKDTAELEKKVVVKSKAVEKIKKITAKIIDLNAKIEKIDQKIASMQ